ncbi:uncharacterized protein LOC125771381 isoform X1 [Anopheles funestus]|uniref:uncharacterized protein LOC125771381 isoform X1 n=1 Tax=Anopheles funestus TaxID=62324 RepID=UPI0020C5B87D|nr:uncharacterized protein LOC125771381 isoform X1 [Anopheles funestus]
MYAKKLKKSGQLAKIRKANESNFQRESNSSDPPIVPTTSDDIIEEAVENNSEVLLDEDAGDSSEPSDDSEPEIAFGNKPFKDLLRLWALSYNVPLKTLTALLKLLDHSTDFNLPKDARTFLKTPILISNQIANVAGGQLWYYGVEKCLQHYFGKETPATSLIALNLSMDGLPLHNSGPTEMWPILMSLPHLKPMPVLVVGIYCGSSKPDNIESYLRPLVDELNFLLDQGTNINGKLVDIQLHAIIADSPARSFLKGVAYHGSRHGCMKCKSIGTHLKSARKVVYQSVCADLRTDKEFRDGVYKEHYRCRSPLLDLNDFDMIYNFVVADLLHLIDLGIVRKLLWGWVFGTLKPFKKWKPSKQRMISEQLINIKFPSEMNRQLRSLRYLKYWKGKEYGNFFRHVSIPILSANLNTRVFDHFKLLYVAVILLTSKTFQQHWAYAGILLERFVGQFGNIYHEHHVTSNVRNLLHVLVDVHRFGPLSDISTYPFENKLFSIKKLVRSAPHPLPQVANRIVELKEVEVATNDPKHTFPMIKMIKDEVILQVNENFLLRKNNKNSWFLTKDLTIIQYHSASEYSDGYKIEGYKVLIKENTFEDPLISDIIYNYKAKVSDVSSTLSHVLVSDIKCKLVCIVLNNEFFFTPLVHTIVSD